MDKLLTSAQYGHFVRSLMVRPRDLAQIREHLKLAGMEGICVELAREYGLIAETLHIRRQIDRFLHESAEPEAIMALLLTIATTGNMFAYNRALMLLKDPVDGLVRGSVGIGSLNREEAWQVWGRIHEEMLDFEELLHRAQRNLDPQRERLRPLLDRLCFDPEAACGIGTVLCGRRAVVFERVQADPSEAWIFDVLGAGQLGIVPMWGPSGHFGDILVDNFATGRPILNNELQVFYDFTSPLIGSFERALLLDRYRAKVDELQEANARIDAQKEMMAKMERRAAMGRYSSLLAHNLINPLVAMTGHIGRLRNGGQDPAVASEVVAELQEDLQGLEDFIGDFISHVETENPSRHFWDINHLVGEAVRSFSNHDPLHSLDIHVEEEEVPLVHMDYKVAYEMLVRLIGLLAYGRGRDAAVRIQTGTTGDEVHIVVGVTAPVPFRASDEKLVAHEIQRIAAFLSREEITLEVEPSRVILRIST